MGVIVVGVDSSTGALAALRWAAAEARLRAADLMVVHAYLRPLAYAGTDADMADLEPEYHRHRQEVLERVLRDAAPALTGLAVERRLHPGNAAHGLIAASAPADLLVVGARGAGGFEGLVLGSTAEHCARHAPCPVVVVPGEPAGRRDRLVAGVDGSPEAQRALGWAVEEAARRDAAVEVVSVYDPYTARRPFGAEFMDVASPGWELRLRRAAEAVAEAAVATVTAPQVPVELRVGAGHPAKVLAERSRAADLVVVGSRGLGGFAGLLLGSVSRQVMHHARCPVAVVRGGTPES